MKIGDYLVPESAIELDENGLLAYYAVRATVMAGLNTKCTFAP